MSQFSQMAQAGQPLAVNVVQAEGLQHLNHFTGDHPYVVCEVKHLQHHATRTKAETQPVMEGDTTNPVWNEVLELERWQPGEALEFTIYDKGLIGSKTEGKAMLPSEYFYPNGFRGMISVVGLPDARLRVEVPPPAGMMQGQVSVMAPMPVTYQAPAPATYAAQPSTYAAQPSTTYAAQPSSVYGSQQMMVPTMAQAAGPQRLAVSILQAHGLQHMNNFTGDHPYVVCEVKNRIPKGGETTKVETKAVTEGDTQNPFWGETHIIEPWHEGEPLEFSVYDRGLIGSKTEGQVVVGPELFFPNGFSGMLSISGLPHAMLHVIVRPVGPWGGENTVMETITDGVTESKRKKKRVKIGKKSKACC